MIRHLRADVTQYSIWHLRHTAPAVAKRRELRNAYLMNLEIEALSDYVETLMWGYRQLQDAQQQRVQSLRSQIARLDPQIAAPR